MIYQPLGLASDVKLRKYQLDAIGWMKGVEENSHTGYKSTTTLVPWYGTRSTVMFELMSKSIILDVKNLLQQLNFKGGILADEEGLGKTLEIIGLILANPKKTITQNDSDNHFFLDLNEKNIYRLAIKTNATLVICPPELVQHWCDEIKSKTYPKMSVVSISVTKATEEQIKSILTADVVVVPNSIAFSTTDPDGIVYQLKYFWNKYPFSVDNVGKHFKEMFDTSHYHWRRVVVDESFKTPRRHRLQHISADFSWVVGDIDCSNERILRDVLFFLHICVQENAYTILQEKLWHHLEFLYKKLFWRNTKESINYPGQSDVPSLTEDTILMNFTKFEKTLYAYCEHTGESVSSTHPALCTKFLSLLPEDSKDFCNLDTLYPLVLKLIMEEVEHLKKESYIARKELLDFTDGDG